MSEMSQDTASEENAKGYKGQTNSLAMSEAFGNRSLASIELSKVDLDGVAPTAGLVNADLIKLIDDSKIWAEAANIISSRYKTLSRTSADNLLQFVSAVYGQSPILAGISQIVAEFRDGVAKAVGQTIRVQNITASLLESLQPSIEAIGKILDSLDTEGCWGSCRESAQEWGGHGWVLLDGMNMHVIRSCPDTLLEANRALKPTALASLPETKAAILANARKRKDAEEMFALYEERHYKPCAMMACSLIEGEIINWKIGRTGTRGVNSKLTSLTIAEDIASSQQAMIELVNVIATYDHFFRNTYPFNRELEGELNRNFLMHGMMYKEVTQVACLKLFNLLEKVTKVLPSCVVDG